MVVDGNKHSFTFSFEDIIKIWLKSVIQLDGNVATDYSQIVFCFVYFTGSTYVIRMNQTFKPSRKSTVCVLLEKFPYNIIFQQESMAQPQKNDIMKLNTCFDESGGGI